MLEPLGKTGPDPESNFQLELPTDHPALSNEMDQRPQTRINDPHSRIYTQTDEDAEAIAAGNRVLSCKSR